MLNPNLDDNLNETNSQSPNSPSSSVGAVKSELDSPLKNDEHKNNVVLDLLNKFKDVAAKTLNAVKTNVLAYLTVLKNSAPRNLVLGLGVAAAALGTAVAVAKGLPLMDKLLSMVATTKAFAVVSSATSAVASCAVHCAQSLVNFLASSVMPWVKSVASQVVNMHTLVGQVVTGLFTAATKLPLQLGEAANFAVGSVLTLVSSALAFLMGKPVVEKAVAKSSEVVGLAASSVKSGVTSLYSAVSTKVEEVAEEVKQQFRSENRGHSPA